MFIAILLLELLVNLNISSASANQVFKNLNSASRTTTFTPLLPTYEMVSNLDPSNPDSIRDYLKIITPPHLPFDVLTDLEIRIDEVASKDGALASYTRESCPTLNINLLLLNQLKNRAIGIDKSFGQILAAITIGHEYQHYLSDISGSDAWIRLKAPKSQGLGGTVYGSSSMPNWSASEMNAFAWQAAALVPTFCSLYKSQLNQAQNFTMDDRKNIIRQLMRGMNIYYGPFIAMADVLNRLTVTDTSELYKKATITSRGDDGKGNISYIIFYLGDQKGSGGKYIVQNSGDGTITVQLEADESPSTDFFLEKTIPFNGDFNDLELVLNTALTSIHSERNVLHKQVEDLRSAQASFDQVQDFLLKQYNSQNDQRALDFNMNTFFKNFKVPQPYRAVSGTKTEYRMDSIHDIFPKCKRK